MLKAALRTVLPVDALIPEIVASLQTQPVLVLEAPAGAGKTTRVPPALLDAGFGEVVVLEPRRIAARMASRRVAEERGERPGETVGYQVRFDQVGGPATKLWFVTEGVLTRRLLANPLLPGVGTVILDEFHERHLDGDLALALLRRLRSRRPELRLVVMSATLRGAELAAALGGCPVLRSEGRLYPLEVEYTPESSLPLEEKVAGAVERLLGVRPKGDVLVFLPGAHEIRRAQRACQRLRTRPGLEIVPLHGDLSPDEQDRAVTPGPGRKVILSTNVAESSITIEGVHAVVDSGLARVAQDSRWSGLPRIEVARIGRASATQRAGRAGRTGPGLVVRLYTEADLLRRPEAEEPEILRRELAPLCLSLHAAGLGRADELEWLDAPPRPHLEAAEELLRRLGALSPEGVLTARGKRMALLPLPPRLAALCVAAADRGVGESGCAAAAALGSGSRLPATAPHAADSDLDILLEKRPDPPERQMERQLAGILRPKRETLPAAERESRLRQACLEAFPDRVMVRRREREWRIAGGASVVQAPNSAVERPGLAVALEVEERPDQGAPIARVLCGIEPEWLLDLFPDRIREQTEAEWNRAAERVEQRSALLFEGLPIEESRSSAPSPEAAGLLTRKALDVGLQRFCDPEKVEELSNRLLFASAQGLIGPLPEGLEETALRRLADGIASFAELERAARDGGLEFAMLAAAGVSQGVLDRIAPDRLRLPNGRHARVFYRPGQPPWVTSRLQDFFGMKETPRVGEGRVALVAHLLAPNQRPVQMTQDLAGFWERLYPQVRKELMRRYPRHAWPENPYLPEPADRKR